MKKAIITFFSVLYVCSNLVHAQIGKGKTMLGSGFSFSNLTQTNSPTISYLELNAQVGFFLTNGFALGPRISYNDQSQSGFSSTSYFVGLFGRPYYKNAYLDIATMYNAQETNLSFFGGSEKVEYATVSIGVGYAFFLNNYVAFEPGFQYMRYISKDVNANRLTFQLGLQIYLGKIKEAKAN